MEKRIIKPFVDNFFQNEVLPNLMNFIRIPNLSPSYDPDWKKDGYALKAVSFLNTWIENQKLKKCNSFIIKDEGHTPFLYVDIEATNSLDTRTFLMYGHYDKQPPFTGWTDGREPTKPKIEENLLYGRGSTDDGYALFAMIASIKACQDNNWILPRIVLLLEGAEESYTKDLFYYVDKLKSLFYNPSLIVCLDSGCADTNRLWVTSSLRGNLALDIKVSVLNKGVHSGIGGGLIPDSFFIFCKLMDNLESSKTGLISNPKLNVDIPTNRMQEIDNMVKIIGEGFYKNNIPWINDTCQTLGNDTKNNLIRNTWGPTLCITGCDNIPDTINGGNVIRPYTSFRFAIRIPPKLDSQQAIKDTESIILSNVPFGAKVEFLNQSGGDGWNLEDKNCSKKLKTIFSQSSIMFYDNDFCFQGEGGSVPFVQKFNTDFPNADIACIGVATPTSNIHGPNENLNMIYCKKLMMCLTYLISAY